MQPEIGEGEGFEGKARARKDGTSSSGCRGDACCQPSSSWLPSLRPQRLAMPVPREDRWKLRANTRQARLVCGCEGGDLRSVGGRERERDRCMECMISWCCEWTVGWVLGRAGAKV